MKVCIVHSLRAMTELVICKKVFATWVDLWERCMLTWVEKVLLY